MNIDTIIKLSYKSADVTPEDVQDTHLKMAQYPASLGCRCFSAGDFFLLRACDICIYQNVSTTVMSGIEYNDMSH